MLDADLKVIDEDPGDAFIFDANSFQKQLVAGIVKNEADLGLTVYVPDAV